MRLRIISKCMIIGLIIGGMFFAAGWYVIAFSFIIGVGGALVYILIMKRQMLKLLERSPAKAKKLAMQGLFIRYMFIILLMAFAAQIKWISMISVLGGLMMIPMAGIISYWEGN